MHPCHATNSYGCLSLPLEYSRGEVLLGPVVKLAYHFLSNLQWNSERPLFSSVVQKAMYVASMFSVLDPPNF